MHLRYSGHIHTCYSSSAVEKVPCLDGSIPWLRKVTPARIIKKAMEEDLDAIIITDSLRPAHFEAVRKGKLKLSNIKDKAYWSVRNQEEYGNLRGKYIVHVIDEESGVLRIERKKDGRTLDYIRGSETRWEGEGRGHILAVGYNEDELLETLLDSDGKAIEVNSLILQAGGISVACHPYNATSGGMDEETVEDLIEAGINTIEWNSQQINFLGRTPEVAACNDKVLERAEESDIPILALNDAQGISQLANAYFEIERKLISDTNYIDSLRDAIRTYQHDNHFGNVTNWQMLNWLVFPSFASYTKLKELSREAWKRTFGKKN